MVEAKKSDDIGMKRGRVLTNLSQPKQLDLIAEGLPVLMKSASDLLAASRVLGEHKRAAAILEGHAMEEMAKILILIDIVRCPPKVRPSRIGSMMNCFYNHLARLIYVDAQTWKPVDTAQLQEYVDDHRKSHHLEGAVGEDIIPNWATFARECTLYADILTAEGGEPVWNEPHDGTPLFDSYDPFPWKICEALRDMGALTRLGLDVVSLAWSQTEFVKEQHWSDAERLTHEMLLGLDKAGLITEAAQQEQLGVLYHRWQLPMYHIDFRRIEVPLSELKAERDSMLWSEYGCY